MQRKGPLYHSVNTRTHGVRHGHGGEYRWSRHAKKKSKSSLGSMHSGQRRGRDYTPLFRFLLSRVGDDWSAVYSEAVSRLDRPDPIFLIVARSERNKTPYVRVGESTYYSGLYVDEDNRLARVDPHLTVNDMEPSCACCTHTFNGVPFTRPYSAR